MDDLALKINQELKNNPLIKEYLALQNKINDIDLNSEEERLILMQKEITNAFTNNYDNYETLKEEYLKRREAFDNHPLIVNYNNTKQEVESLLNQYKTIIENEL